MSKDLVFTLYHVTVCCINGSKKHTKHITISIYITTDSFRSTASYMYIHNHTSFEKLCLEAFLPPVFLLKCLPLFKNTCNPITPLSHEVFVIIRQQISHVSISISGRQPGLACISIVLTEHVLTEPSTFNLSGKGLKHSDSLQSTWVI